MTDEETTASLFSRAPAQEESETSVLAAIEIQPLIGRIDKAVLECITSSPCTDQEGQDRTGIDGNTWRPARRRLERAGRIRADGIRKTRAGRDATLWRVVKPGEPPGTRRRPAVGAGLGREAVSAGRRRQTQTTQQTAEKVGVLWTAVRDCRPAWMADKQHQGVVKAAIENHPGDIVSGLQQALRELQALGGGR